MEEHRVDFFIFGNSFALIVSCHLSQYITENKTEYQQYSEPCSLLHSVEMQRMSDSHSYHVCQKNSVETSVIFALSVPCLM